MSSISEVVFNTNDTIVTMLYNQIDNLKLIIKTKDDIYDNDIAIKNKKIKKARHNTFMTSGIAGLLVLLLLL